RLRIVASAARLAASSRVEPAPKGWRMLPEASTISTTSGSSPGWRGLQAVRRGGVCGGTCGGAADELATRGDSAREADWEAGCGLTDGSGGGLCGATGDAASGALGGASTAEGADV